MSNKKYDVLIIGGGNAGLGVTVATRAAGMSVAVAEPRELGGTCPNRGCTPKKVLVAATHALADIERAGTHCISVGRPTFDWPALIAREKKMIEDIPARLARAMADRGVEVLRERAVFAGPNTVKVGERTIEATHIVIATGSKPRPLPIPGAEHMITSDDVLSEAERPGEVIFVGGGVIALELGHVYARAGSKVTVLEALPQLLPAMDADAVAQVHAVSGHLGIDARTGVKVKKIAPQGARLRVTFEHAGKEQTLDADRVVNGAGRVADIDQLNLEAAGVTQRNGRIDIDAHLRSTSNKAVHVCGDAVWNSPQLSPIATYEGRIVGRNIVEGPVAKHDYASIPSCVYTIPSLSSVGLTEAKARETGRPIKVHANDMSGWLSARTFNEEAAWAKIIVDEESDRIVGAHIVGHSGEELIHIFAMAMKHGIGASAVREAVYAFPTCSADIKSML
ncbi:MAG TPA: NAD(P)/FAD-dependent oxidoreductase [Pseudolabrys sp.]|nr:NAD(P)/FAD-dependent oxidoreductase [Pseudolabrys sp.]